MTETDPKPEKAGENQATRGENGQFLPGVSGNPAGKPPGTKHLTTKLFEYLQKVAKDKNGDPDPEQKTYADKLIERILVETVGKGNSSLIQMIYERIDGKPDQGINLNMSGELKTGDDVMLIAKRVAEELKANKTE